MTPTLILGTEKPLIIANLTFTAVWIIAAHWTWTAFLAIPFFIIVHILCVQMSKRDPIQANLFLIRQRYIGYYPAISGEEVMPASFKFKAMPSEFYGTIKNKLS